MNDMKFITKAEELAGKTIDRAVLVYCLEEIVMVFTDNTCAYIKASSNYDGYEVSLSGDAKDYIKLEAGLISEEEYDLRNLKKKG